MHSSLSFYSVWHQTILRIKEGINYFADLRMTFGQNIFLQDRFRNKFGVGLG
jgi:hypothetical protein